MLALYRGLTIAAGPLIGRYLQRRLTAGKEDRERFAERLGTPSRTRPPGPLIWLHGASVGEGLSALPLIERLLEACPGSHVLLTTGTVTSARLLAGRLPARAFHQYVPIDRPHAVGRFLDHWRPDLAIWIESELWPNLVSATQARGVPTILVQARMSARSFAGWRRLRPFVAPLLGGFRLVLAQTPEDAGRFTALGAKDVRLAGNLKYAAPPLPVDDDALAALRAACGDRPLWVAASTHPGEEAVIAAAHRAIAGQFPDLLTLVVPRHPDRGAEVAALFAGCGLATVRRAGGGLPAGDTAVYVADTMGELGLVYNLADVVFVGGSLVPHGGQNLLEPARLGCAILHGPHVDNFAGVAAELAAAGGARAVSEADVAANVAALLAEPAACRAMARAAEAVAGDRAEVLDAVMAALEPFLPVEAAAEVHARA